MQTFLKELFLHLIQIEGVRLVDAYTQSAHPPQPVAYPAVLVQVVRQTPRHPRRTLQQVDVTLRLHVLQRTLVPSHLPVPQGQQPTAGSADAWALPNRVADAVESWTGPAPAPGKEYATPLERLQLTETEPEGETTTHLVELRTSLIYLP